MMLIGIPAVAIVEGAIIYYYTGNKWLSIIGVVESSIPGVDVVPFATISKIVAGKR
ncbi:MAG: hypothetical protein K0B02_00870 [DPANN group archaeon]|nr:hypothetical protein [DPANN group archaeon]